MDDQFCQYCQQGPFESVMIRKIHEQQFCPDAPKTSEQVSAQAWGEDQPSVFQEQLGQSGSSINDEIKEEWSKQTGRVTRLLFYNPDPNFLVSSRLQAKLERINEMRKREPQKIWLVGDAGTGKTSLALQFAAKTKSPCLKCPCPAMTEVSQWMGRTEYHPERGTHYIPSLFIEAAETPGAVIILNDITRVENPKVLNPLMDITDETGSTWSDELGREVRVADGVVFIATSNEGWEYTGADDPDAALKERFDVIHMPLPPKAQLKEIVARKVGNSPEIDAAVEFFLQCLSKGIRMSLRHVLRMCKDIKYGASLVDAAVLSAIGDMDKDHQQEALQILQVQSSSVSGLAELINMDESWGEWQ